MIIDVLCIALLAHATFKGLSRGFIVAIFSLLAIIIGLAAATKLSASVAIVLQEKAHFNSAWLPFVSFAIVMLLVVLLVRWMANAAEQTVEFALMGWINKLGGVLFYALIYLLILSVVLFFLWQLKILEPTTWQQSICWPWLQPLGPKVINALGSVIPFFKGLFSELESFFEMVNTKATNPPSLP
jgi:membrane protein required for colicin V production